MVNRRKTLSGEAWFEAGRGACLVKKIYCSIKSKAWVVYGRKILFSGA